MYYLAILYRLFINVLLIPQRIQKSKQEISMTKSDGAVPTKERNTFQLKSFLYRSIHSVNEATRKCIR